MSYEKLYSKQFVKVEENWIIPMTLSGSSNCTMYYGGREIYERSWFQLLPHCDNHIDYFTKSISEIRAYFEARTKEGNPEGEWFKDINSGKWITNASFMKWFDSGVKSAKTIEEVRKAIVGQGLVCKICLHHNSEFKCLEENYKYCTSTEDLKNWIYSLKDYKAPEDYYISYIVMGWSGIEPLHLGRNVKENIPVVCKVKSQYLYAYNDSSLSYSKDKNKAIVFNNKEDFENKLLPVLHKFHNTKWTLVSAESAKKEVEKNFAILVKRGSYCGAYIKKKAKYTVYFSGQGSAKKFPTQKSAEKWAEEKLGYLSTEKGYQFEVVKVDMGEV